MTEVKVSVADLINGELLKPGTVVVLRTLEGVITDQGTIRAAGANGLGVVDYRTPTSWSRVVCKINSSGWRQVKLKDEKTSLYTLKQKYIQRKGGDAKEDKPPKRQKTPNKSHVPNTTHIPHQLQFITSPLQQQLNQQPQPHQLVLPMAIVTPPKQQVLQMSQSDTDPSNPNAGAPTTSTALVSPLPPSQQAHQVVDVPPPPPASSYIKFKLAPPTTKTKMLELLVYIEDPTMIPFMLNTTASSFDSLHYVLLESFPQYKQKQFGIDNIGVWSDQWGEFVKPPPNWDQFPSKTKVIVKTFPFRWNAREYEPPSNTTTQGNGTSTSTSSTSSSGAQNVSGSTPGAPTANAGPGTTQVSSPVMLPQVNAPGVVVGAQPNMGQQIGAVPSPGGSQGVVGGHPGTPPSSMSLPMGASPPPPSPPSYVPENATSQA
jgi:hypothetical protein